MHHPITYPKDNNLLDTKAFQELEILKKEVKPFIEFQKRVNELNPKKMKAMSK